LDLCVIYKKGPLLLLALLSPIYTHTRERKLEAVLGMRIDAAVLLLPYKQLRSCVRSPGHIPLTVCGNSRRKERETIVGGVSYHNINN
jgi:hypothetical protein